MTDKVKEIQENIKKGKCAWCGADNPDREYWQYWNNKAQTKDKHQTVKWCSDNCIDLANNSGVVIDNSHPGKHHSHKGNTSCLCEID